jgi:hypothetical protein
MNKTRIEELKESFVIVLDLARQSVLDVDKCDPEMYDEAVKQMLALETVELHLELMGLKNA